MVVQRVRGKGWQQALAAALEQADIQVVFELANLLRECRLGDGKALGSTAHMAFFVHRDEITQLFEIHKYYLSKMLKKRNGSKAGRRLVYAHSKGLVAPEKVMKSDCAGLFYIGKAENPTEGLTAHEHDAQLQIDSAYGHKVSVHEPV